MARPARLSRALLPASALLLILPVLHACGDEPREAVEETLEAGMVQPAAFDASIFDSIAWPTPKAAVYRGATVYAYSCRRCHGDRGAGDGGYRLEGRLVRPPSFRAADWRFGADLEGLREIIAVGGERGMPRWCKAGLPPRDVDAVARYIMRRLWGEA